MASGSASADPNLSRTNRISKKKENFKHAVSQYDTLADTEWFSMMTVFFQSDDA